MFEFQVTLSLPVEAQNITDAIEEFRHDARFGTDYVYQVDTGEGLVHYDTETGEATPAARIDKGTLDALAERLYATAHDQPSDADGISAIRTELYRLFGMV